MKTVFEHFSGEKYNAPLPVEGKGSVKAIHYIQSFDPQDNVSPELAHRIAIKLDSIIKISKEMFISRQGIYYHLELGEKEIEQLI